MLAGGLLILIFFQHNQFIKEPLVRPRLFMLNQMFLRKLSKSIKTVKPKPNGCSLRNAGNNSYSQQHNNKMFIFYKEWHRLV